jgi:Inner membrane component of T3SS, cytoplasmic domain
VDSIDLLILALRLVFVALLYLFLFVVLRLAVAGLRGRETAAAPAEARLKLVVLEPGVSGLSAGEIIAVADGATLGRGDASDVVLSDTAVSAQHARVERLGRRWVVTDLSSTNGTRINDAPVQPRGTLSAGDVLSLGTVRLQVMPR